MPHWEKRRAHALASVNEGEAPRELSQQRRAGVALGRDQLGRRQRPSRDSVGIVIGKATLELPRHSRRSVCGSRRRRRRSRGSRGRSRPTRAAAGGFLAELERLSLAVRGRTVGHVETTPTIMPREHRTSLVTRRQSADACRDESTVLAVDELQILCGPSLGSWLCWRVSLKTRRSSPCTTGSISTGPSSWVVLNRIRRGGYPSAMGEAARGSRDTSPRSASARPRGSPAAPSPTSRAASSNRPTVV